MTHAFVFPGQGAQIIGMGKDLADNFQVSKNVFEQVDEALGEKLSTLIWHGDKKILTLTENAQPALMACSIAAVEALELEGVKIQAASYVSGHSLGEYSALCATGALNLADTARLLRIRGRAMQAAVPLGQGAMAAILGLGFDAVQAVITEITAKTSNICQVANDNDPTQVVISGDKKSVTAAMDLAKKKGAKRAILLPVSAPFHCNLMQPAAVVMAESLKEIKITAPKIPVIANVLAAPITNPEQIKQRLVQQVTGLVRWRETVLWMRDRGVDSIYELGVGKVLSNMIRRSARNITCKAVSHSNDVRALAAILPSNKQ